MKISQLLALQLLPGLSVGLDPNPNLRYLGAYGAESAVQLASVASCESTHHLLSIVDASGHQRPAHSYRSDAV